MIKNRLIPTLALAGATSLAAMLTPVAATAVTFTVNRSWSGSATASLVGTVDVPVGSYTIQNGTPNPFTNVNLILTVNGNPFPVLNAANTSGISGTGQFLVNATSSTLTFNTANANGSNAANLAFVNSSTGLGGPLYAIGFDSIPGFEVAFGTTPNVLASVAFPVTFGTVQQVQQVPEPASLFGLGVLSTLGAASTLKRKLKPSQSIEKETTKVG
ncbi:MAG: PEP-CTERM sorting domain-containing protein [Microcystis wesenbergii Mw_QC_S_20081001_S30D]|uniref:PEP-CTERM sorting domain-containing protein n=1 Tax=Microcystis wesenbergii Mw_QC_S_20081001_S30D TaxID=2486245 RepID=A0A552JTD4_9CHRO|nr:PEP-CTERM sorting domain-containing protein [Microcystis aeruginosa W11-03]NCR92797.1 PEP-CTERM sorting domain-containing protein [Microcystis aeruginosa W11-06]TRU99026.1 MAG: PEP-CTERM sorting domain-containing protein [Microcystis wesenbergii Mw_QC_S_20081001_S30D]TRV02051.1 MAG: PEP-CTERM sorting domain-containing protein [Microcystis wesenbergii Mw_QC_S_20081001_S30]